MSNEPTVFVVDDDAGVRKSLQLLLASASLPTRAFASAEEFERGYLSGQGCLILDLHMPGTSGLDLLKSLQRRRIDLPVIVLTAAADLPTAVRSMKLGATDFLEKPADPAMLVARVRDALAADALRHQSRATRETTRQRLASLTTRERELLDLLVNGHSNKQIAAALDLSIKTVANHRAHLIAKMRAVNTADLVRLAMMGQND